MLSAYALAHALGGHKVGGNWMARCPAHDDRTPSLSIRDSNDGIVLVYCHAGCEQSQVIAAFRNRGLWPCSDQRHYENINLQSYPFANLQRNREDAERTKAALHIWDQAQPGAGSFVQNYLLNRGISFDLWPATIRYHPNCCRPRDAAGNIVSPAPAMVALVEHVQHGPVAIHRTFLRPDGSGKATVEPNKACLGPVAGGAVRFGMPSEGEWIAVAEGIETSLSVAVACSMPAWAAISCGGVKHLILPPEATHVVICADHDASGTGQRAARDAARRWLAEGRQVRVSIPPIPGTDFNDVLIANTKGESHVA